MPVQDDFVDMDKHDKRRHTDMIMPLSKTDWRPRFAFTFRRCEFSGKLIMPFTTAYRQQVFWGLANAETHSELEEKWLTPASYTFKKLNGTL